MRMDTLRGPDAGTLLVRALRSQATGAGVDIAIRRIASRPWASATFVGTRHRVAVDVRPADTLAPWIAALPEMEWTIHGHLVADVVVDAVTTEGDAASVLMSILTIEDN